MEKTKQDWIETINCHIIAIIILMNAFQIIIAWDFGIIFNMWIEYIFIALLFGINRFKIVNIKNILIIGIIVIIFGLNVVLNNTKTLKFYINEFLLFALPLILIFLINIDLKKFTKILYIYNIVNIILYLLLIVINPDKLIQDYMTFGFYAIFSLVYVLVYAYYNKHKKIFLCSIIAVPIIFINGNRGTILISTVAIIFMIFMNEKNLKRKLIFVAMVTILACNINSIARFVLDFVVEDLGVDSYSVNSLYSMLDSDNTEGAIGGRYTIYKEAIKEIKQHPILGIGVASFQENYGYFPHNIFLDAYSTFGIFIGSIYIIYIAWIGIKLYNISKKDIEVRILFIFMFANIMKLMLSKTFIYDPTIWLYISLGNFIIAKYGGKSNENNSIHTDLQ